jgi:hypothetical protein
MNILLTAARLYIPGFIKKRRLAELFAITAEAFGCIMPDIRGLSYTECLTAYAQFTSDAAEQAIRQGADLETIHDRLYRNACTLGQTIRKQLHITTTDDAMIAARILYSALNIDFHGDGNGGITINRCFFSDYYSGGVCRLISSLDAGVLAGLTGRENLVFSQRITESGDCCRASLDTKDPLL